MPTLRARPRLNGADSGPHPSRLGQTVVLPKFTPIPLGDSVESDIPAHLYRPPHQALEIKAVLAVGMARFSDRRRAYPVICCLHQSLLLMYECPSCKASTVRFVRKRFSSRSFPVECTACGGLSYAPGSAGGIVMVLNTVLFTLAGFAGGLLAVIGASCPCRFTRCRPLVLSSASAAAVRSFPRAGS